MTRVFHQSSRAAQSSQVFFQRGQRVGIFFSARIASRNGQKVADCGIGLLP